MYIEFTGPLNCNPSVLRFRRTRAARSKASRLSFLASRTASRRAGPVGLLSFSPDCTLSKRSALTTSFSSISTPILLAIVKIRCTQFSFTVSGQPDISISFIKSA
ncbi:unnamed protein product [Chrysodeixis includens]|uniref:Uncharacterized protein n=1 Tax=Chrysodeixis includens TaxID=689277 RepID=A0A9P0BXC8_CHRIL|nr:unnamed protein product [Chrysodeixis includens]